MSAASSPSIEISPRSALTDEPVQIRLGGLPPGATVEVRARMPAWPGHRWESHATFVANATGAVDLTTARPVAGSYADPDPMGMIWSMALVPAPGEAPSKREAPLPPTVITFAAEIDGQSVAEATAERVRLAPGVQRKVVRERGLVGTFFLPPGPGPHAGILLLGGSEGGLHEPDAALLAAHGYATLALAYFGMEGVPPDLVEIPLEYFGTAIEWLRAQEGVRGAHLGVIGGSRGGEAALLLGTTFPAITAVVSYLGSGVITQGIGGGEILEKVNTDRPSWTFGGRPLPYLPMRTTPTFEAQVHAEEPVDLGMVFHAAMANSAAVWEATIPVERINGPILLISAGDDRSWPTTRLSTIAEDRLAQHNHPHPVRHLHYERAGHGLIPPPFGPTTVLVVPLPGGSMHLGGTPQANAAASANAWRQTLAFLEEHLG